MNPRALLRRMRGLFAQSRLDRDFAEELAAHLEAAAADFVAQGLTPEQAERKARLQLGNLTAVREQRRQQRGLPFLASIAGDLRYAARQLWRSPGFALVSILMLAVGIGATTAIYCLIDSILLRPLPFAAQQELVKVSGFYPKGWVRAVQQRSQSMASVMSVAPSSEHNIQTSSGPDRIFAANVTTNAFEVLGVRPQAGRFFLPAEALSGRDKIVVISNGFWRQNLGASRQAVGSTLQLDGETRTIIGIAPAGISFPDSSTRLWLPVAFKPGDVIDPWAMFSGQMIGRLRPGVTVAMAQAEMRTLHPALLKLFPWPMPDSWYADVTVTPLLHAVVEDARPKLLLLFGAVTLVLLVACANVANLMLARATSRSREISVRSALGATTRRLVRQMLTESLLLGTIAGACGVLLSMAGVHALKQLLPADTPRLEDAGVHPGAMLFVAALSIATSLFFGMAPAWKLRSRSMRDDLRGSASNLSPGRGAFRLSSLLVIGQIATAVVTLLVAGLMLHSLWRLTHVDPGFATEHLLTARVSLNTSSCTPEGPGDHCMGFYRDLLERAQTTHGIRKAALVSLLPMQGPDQGFAFDVEDHPRSPRQQADQGSSRTVSPSYFQLLGIRLLHGRLFTGGDASGISRAVIINRQMAEHYWPGLDPLGKRIEWVGRESRQGILDDRAFLVAGVVSDTRHEALAAEPGYEMYTPPAPDLITPAMSLLVLTTDSPSQTAQSIRQLVASLDASAPVNEVQTLSSVVQGSAASQKSLTTLLGAFAVIALGVGALGVYSLIGYMVSSRTREMGIRLALGATRQQLTHLVMLQGLTLAGIGLLAGLALSLLISHALRSFLYATSPLDPAAFAVVPLLLAALTLLATLAPARRAARIQPMEALRTD